MATMNLVVKKNAPTELGSIVLFAEEKWRGLLNWRPIINLHWCTRTRDMTQVSPHPLRSVDGGKKKGTQRINVGPIGVPGMDCSGGVPIWENVPQIEKGARTVHPDDIEESGRVSISVETARLSGLFTLMFLTGLLESKSPSSTLWRRGKKKTALLLLVPNSKPI